MPSSSAYAAPIDLDLRRGRCEQGGRVVVGLLALGALALSDVPLQIGLLGAALAVLILVRDEAGAARRPPQMRLHADGGVECAAEGALPLGASFSPQAGRRWVQGTRMRGVDDEAFAPSGEPPHPSPAVTPSPRLPGEGTGELMHPATLLQATSFLGLTQLRWSDSNEKHHACVLFPDCLDADTRHRLRVWLATHRPENPLGGVPAASAPA